MDRIFGTIPPPSGISNYTPASGDVLAGLPLFFNNIIKLLIIAAGLYTLLNLIFAGYGFLSAGDDPKKIQGAWSKIWQSLLGLAVTAGSFTLAAIFGKIVFNDWNALLQFKVFGP
jgi:hypothetical protein